MCRTRAARAALLSLVLAVSLPVAPALARTSSASVRAPLATSLETAASRAGDTARQVAFSMIGLALAVAAVVLCFKRDFKEAVGVLAIGVIAVLLASPAGVGLLQDTVNLLFS